MKPAKWANVALIALCIGAGAAWILHLLGKPVPDPIVDHAHASSATVFARPCDTASGEGYIAFGQWKLDEYGPVLEITPTPCGRDTFIELKNQLDEGKRSEARDHLEMEAIEKFSGNVNWRNTRGLINQLDCHILEYPDKPTWNIEPDRPYVGYDLTRQAQCNPSVPLPDSPFR